jgi:glycosyltransferase involved in cell wall biosynthesis
MSAPQPSVDESRCCIYLPCYNAARFVAQTVGRIPWSDLPAGLTYEVLLVDNASTDGTAEAIEGIRRALESEGRAVHVIRHGVNRGYGGSVKAAMGFCRDRGLGYLVVLHADGQYAPEVMPRLLGNLLEREREALHFGSRLSGRPLRGGMPVYKYLANGFLTWLQNVILGLWLSEYHSGYRLYRMRLLAGVPFEKNSDGFVFDNEILFQLAHFGLAIGESPIPTHYGEEKSHVPVISTPLRILGCAAGYLLVKLGWRSEVRYEQR